MDANLQNSEQDAKEFFIRESLVLSRSMPIQESRTYLRGLLIMIGDCEEAHPIRSAAVLLDQSDRQLELLIQPKL